MQLKKFLMFGLLAAVLPAVAEEAADRKTATSLKYVEHELDTRQNKFGADTNKAMEYTSSAGTVQKRTVKSDLGSDTSDTSLPMVGGVNTKLNQKQDDIAAVNDHTAVTYTGQPGGIGQKGIYQTTESYAAQSDNLIDAKTFNAALKNGLDSEFKCRDDNRDPVSGLCWLYTIHNAIEDNTLLPTGYTPLEYIESTGTQYINTGLVVPSSSETVTKFDAVAAYTAATGRNFIGGYADYGHAHYCEFKANQFGYNGASQDNNAYFSPTLSANIKYNISMQINGATDTVLSIDVNGTTYSHVVNKFQASQMGTFVLFALGSDNLAPSLRLYSAQIRIDGVLRRNFIPASHIENNTTVVGMYDTVSRQFFPNAGNGDDFIAGPPVLNANIYVPQNQ